MKVNVTHLVKLGRRISYDDGRPGHRGVEGTVVAIEKQGMTVQFDDRVDTNYIRFSDERWMDFISVVERTEGPRKVAGLRARAGSAARRARPRACRR